MPTPVPEGVTASFANVVQGGTTANFHMDEGLAVMTYQPADSNNPGTATLYTSAGVSVTSCTEPGYADFAVPVGGGSYYFVTTEAANLIAGTMPSNRDRW